MADIFISYSSQNEPTVRAICTCLRKAGITCWVAYENAEFGVSYAKTITENLIACRVVLVCMSRAAGTSPHVERELDIAVNENKKILPILLESFDLSGTCFRYYAGSTHYMHFSPTVQFRNQLLQRVRELLPPGPGPTPPPPPGPTPQPPQRPGMGFLKLHRVGSFSAALRAFKVLIDGRQVTTVNADQTRQIQLPAGMHTLQLKVDWIKSNEVSLFIRENETVYAKCTSGGAFVFHIDVELL